MPLEKQKYKFGFGIAAYTQYGSKFYLDLKYQLLKTNLTTINIKFMSKWLTFFLSYFYLSLK